jgi:hypothetical protein
VCSSRARRQQPAVEAAALTCLCLALRLRCGRTVAAHGARQSVSRVLHVCGYLPRCSFVCCGPGGRQQTGKAAAAEGEGEEGALGNGTHGRRMSTGSQSTYAGSIAAVFLGLTALKTHAGVELCSSFFCVFPPKSLRFKKPSALMSGAVATVESGEKRAEVDVHGLSA